MSTQQVAVPGIVQKAIQNKEIPPGHKYLLYWSGWQPTTYQKKKVKTDELKKVAVLPPFSVDHIKSLIARQKAIAGNDVVQIKATAIAPFTTGLGEAHPLENGFAFLSPYGIPYYPGSGIKGAVRKAAEILALTGEGGWNICMVWWLFGFDANSVWFVDENSRTFKELPDELRERIMGYQERYREHMKALKNDNLYNLLESLVTLMNREQKEKIATEDVIHTTPPFLNRIKNFHLRGSLVFWDCYPLPPKREMHVDIMNPHQSEYYQKGHPPGTWESPTPINFLTLPTGTQFNYFVELKPVATLPDSLKASWKPTITSAFKYALETQGMGAKTSVGYGIQQKHNNGKEDSQAESDSETGDALEELKTDIEKLIEEIVKKKQWSKRDEAVNLLSALKDKGGDCNKYASHLLNSYKKFKKKDPQKVQNFKEELIGKGLLNKGSG